MRVAIAQSAPVFNDLPASLARLEALARDAAARAAKLVVFGETWLSGYPAWLDHCGDAALWNHEPTKRLFARMRANSVEVPSATTAAIGDLARELGVVIVTGANERAGGTLYNALLIFDADGRLVRHHRKLVPTYTERLVWGAGDGEGLQPVDTSAGRVGGLVCWEHWMPLARQALHDGGERIHVALWPTVHEMHQIASRHYAFEGRCFVLAAGSILPARDLPSELGKPEGIAGGALLLRGGSAVIGPDGAYVVGPVFDEETIVVADLDLEMIDREVMTLDVSGHYARPDVFTFGVRGANGRK
jgi:predicted amidohydrolase